MSADRPLLTVEIRQEVVHEVTVDLVTHFESLSERERDNYRRMDSDAFVYRDEWSWPMEYLTPEDDGYGSSDGFDGLTGPGVAPGLGYSDPPDVTVRRRDRTSGDRPRWTEADFAVLLGAVPWLAAFHNAREGLGSEECACGVRIRPNDGYPGGWEHVTGGWVSDHPVEPREATIEDRIRANSGSLR